MTPRFGFLELVSYQYLQRKPWIEPNCMWRQLRPRVVGEGAICYYQLRLGAQRG